MTSIRDTPAQATSWNSLEICKLLVGLMLPVALLLAGNRFTRYEQEHDRLNAQADERQKRDIDQRFTVWEQMAPSMDKIYSYFLYVGDWKNTKPENLIDAKRHLDELMYTNKIFFSDRFFNSYDAFMKSGFRTYRGWGEDPALRTVQVRPFDKGSSVAFESCDNQDAIYRTFWAFQESSRAELDLPHVAAGPRPPKPSVEQGEPCHEM